MCRIERADAPRLRTERGHLRDGRLVSEVVGAQRGMPLYLRNRLLGLVEHAVVVQKQPDAGLLRGVEALLRFSNALCVLDCDIASAVADETVVRNIGLCHPERPAPGDDRHFRSGLRRAEARHCRQKDYGNDICPGFLYAFHKPFSPITDT